MFRRGDQIGLVCCSNGLPASGRGRVGELKQVLENMGLSPVFSPFLFEGEGFLSGTAKERANVLMEFYKNPEIRAVFDLSGGDAANEILDHLDYSVIDRCGKPFFGYSDLTVVLNGIFCMTGREGYLYQLFNLVYGDWERQRKGFSKSLMGNGEDLFSISWEFIQGTSMSGTVVGGNARCFLKLAGTPYMPDMGGKLLFLEARGGNGAKLLTEICQMRQMGIFEKINGLLLGTFTEMEQAGDLDLVEKIVKMEIAAPGLPVAKTSQVGHGPDAKCLVIGKYMELSKKM